MLSSAEFAYLLDVTPKWLHNAALRLKRPLHHTVKDAIRLALARRIHEGVGIPLPMAVDMANEAIHGDIDAPFTVNSSDGIVRLTIDVSRFLIAFNARLAWMRTHSPIPERGRKPVRRKGGIAAAREYGLDISLISSNLRRTPIQRLETLNDNIEFIKSARRRIS